MKLPEYIGFKTARERIATYNSLGERLQTCLPDDELDNDIKTFIKQIRAEIAEGVDHHGFDYETAIKLQQRQYRRYMQLQEEFTSCY